MKKSCIHHWIIDRDQIGTCRDCGTIKHFPRRNELAHLAKHRLSGQELENFARVARLVRSGQP